MSKSSIVCFKHQNYDGTTPPTLSCKTCCHIFVAKLREAVAQKQAARDAQHWLTTKKEEAEKEALKLKRPGSALRTIPKETVPHENR